MWQKIVGDVMVPIDQYPYIHVRDTLLKAMEKIDNAVIETKGRSSMPRVLLVFSDEGLVGIVRRRDILKGLEPQFLVKKSIQARKKLFDAKENPQFSQIDYKKILKGVMENAEKPVVDFILPIHVTIDFYDHIFKAVYEMNQYGLSQLPVLKDGEVVGVIRTVDVFHEVAEVLLRDDYIW